MERLRILVLSYDLWYWDQVADRLRAKGHEVIAMHDLPMMMLDVVPPNDYEPRWDVLICSPCRYYSEFDDALERIELLTHGSGMFRWVLAITGINNFENCQCYTNRLVLDIVVPPRIVAELVHRRFGLETDEELAERNSKVAKLMIAAGYRQVSSGFNMLKDTVVYQMNNTKGLALNNGAYVYVSTKNNVPLRSIENKIRQASTVMWRRITPEMKELLFPDHDGPKPPQTHEVVKILTDYANAHSMEDVDKLLPEKMQSAENKRRRRRI